MGMSRIGQYPHRRGVVIVTTTLGVTMGSLRSGRGPGSCFRRVAAGGVGVVSLVNWYVSTDERTNGRGFALRRSQRGAGRRTPRSNPVADHVASCGNGGRLAPVHAQTTSCQPPPREEFARRRQCRSTS